MNPNLLITKDDFAGYADLSINLKDERMLNQYIQNAQEFDLKTLMGKEFYYDLLANKNSESYTKLLNGDTYKSKNVDIQFLGLRPVLVYFSYARYASNANVLATPTGLKFKTIELSENIDGKTRSYLINNAQSIANGYWQDAIDYLNANSNQFPLWEIGCSVETRIKKSSARISAIKGNG